MIGSKKIFLVSACLTGKKCRYNGDNKLSPDVLEFLSGKNYLAVCPEIFSGFGIPHPPAEISGGTGKDVLEGNAKVLNSEGKDVTDEYIRGALETLDVAVKNGVNIAILKDKSPACGVDSIHNGDFKGKLISGIGVTAAILKKNGIKTLSEKNIGFLSFGK